MINRQFAIHRGDTWPGFVLVVNASDPINDPIDFTDSVASSDIRETPNGALVVLPDITTETDATAATVTVSLTSTKTALLQGTLVSDVQLLLADGRVFTPLKYQLNVTPDAARGGAGAITATTYHGGLTSGTSSCSPIAASIATIPVPIIPSPAPSTGDIGVLDELLLRTAGGDVVRITVVQSQGVYNLRVGQPT